MVFVGWVCVVLGGLVAAVTGPLGLDRGSWLAAYLVLVCGVGTAAIGTMQSGPGSASVSSSMARFQLACWVIGNVAVIGGTLGAVGAILDIGAALLVAALVIALLRTAGSGPATALGPWPRSLLWAYRCLLVVLIGSAPIGVVLAHLDRAS